MTSGSWVLDSHRKRIYTEEKAKFVAAVTGTEFIKFLAVLAVLQDDMKKRMNCTGKNEDNDESILFFKLSRVQNTAKAARN